MADEQKDQPSGSQTFKLKLISPEKVVFKGEVISAILPGIHGNFGVLPRHAHFVTQLGQGPVSVTIADDSNTNEQKTITFQISGGFCEVGKKCIVLIDELVA